jgi:hypothetical protein
MTVLRFDTAGVRVDLDCPDPEVAALVADVGGAMLAADAGPADVTARAAADGEPLEPAAARALSVVDRAALGATRCLAVHAAVVAGPRGCAVVPGASGAGKSTLAGAAMQRGLALLSDEAACFTDPVGTLVPHPRPLGLSGHSRALLGLAQAGESDEEQAVAPALLGGCLATTARGRAVLVALPVRRPGSPPRWDPVPRSEALAALLGSCLNVSAEGGGGWSTAAAWRHLTAVVSGVETVRLTFDNPHSGARLLAEALA